MWPFDSPVKTITHANGTFKLGRRRPVARCPRPSLKNYLFDNLPEPPASGDYSGPAMAALSKPYCNLDLGCCVVAGAAHVEGVLTAGSGRAPTVFSDAQIVQLYGQIGGYRPGHPETDQGCDEQTMLNLWLTKDLGDGTLPIAGWIGLEASNLKTALYLFENAVLGIELPDAWVNPAPTEPGFVWDVAGPANPENGHCVVLVGWNERGVHLASWGMLGLMTWAAVSKYITGDLSGEAYAVLSKDSISRASAKAPNGFAWDQLVSDFELMK